MHATWATIGLVTAKELSVRVDSQAKSLLVRVLQASQGPLPAALVEEIRVATGLSSEVFRPDLQRTDVLDQIGSESRPWHLDLVEFFTHDPTMTVALMALMAHGERLASVSRPKGWHYQFEDAWISIERRLPPGVKILEW